MLSVALVMFGSLGAIASANPSVSVGVVDGAGDVNLSVRVDFGDDNSACGKSAVCDSINATCLAQTPTLQPEQCQFIFGSLSVETVTTATEQVSLYYNNVNCSGSSMSSERQDVGVCKSRSDGDKEARQYFPLIGVCNTVSTGNFEKRYIGEPSELFPTDVCTGDGSGSGTVFTIMYDKVFRVTYSNSSCVSTPTRVQETTLPMSAVYCLDFAAVNIDWNLDGMVNNDGRNVSAEVATTTTTTTAATTTAVTTTAVTTTGSSGGLVSAATAREPCVLALAGIALHSAGVLAWV